MNGIEDNVLSQHWTQMAKEIPTPAAVLVAFNTKLPAITYHYMLLIYTLGVKDAKDAVSFFNDKVVADYLPWLLLRLIKQKLLNNYFYV